MCGGENSPVCVWDGGAPGEQNGMCLLGMAVGEPWAVVLRLSEWGGVSGRDGMFGNRATAAAIVEEGCYGMLADFYLKEWLTEAVRLGPCSAGVPQSQRYGDPVPKSFPRLPQRDRLS